MASATLTVTDNTFIGQELNGAIANPEDGISGTQALEEPDAIIRGNSFEAGDDAFRIYRAIHVHGDSRVEGNDILMGEGIYGIDVASASGSIVANNSVRVLSTATGASAGAGIAAGAWATVVHNTVSMANGRPAIELDDALSAISFAEIHNNIFSTSAGPVLVDNGSPSIESSDHNVFISPTFPVEYAGSSLSLISWQNTTGFDLSTTEDAVTFADEATGDLHLAGASVDGLDLIAAPLPSTLAIDPIDADIDGDPRDAINPKRGADEGTPLPPLDDADVGGFYAVAGTAPDFAEPAEAFEQLLGRGMKGPVTFRIRAGSFTVRESFPNTLRVGAAATDPAAAPLVIRGANPASPPTLVSGATAASNWTFRFRGFDHVELSDLAFDASGAGDNGRVIVLKEGSDGEGTDDFTLTTSSLAGDGFNTTDTEDRALVWSDDDGHDRLTITDNTFTDGWAGVYLPGTASSDSPGATISGNTFADQRGHGLYGSLGNLLLSGNVFRSGSAATAVRLGATEGYRILGNKVYLPNRSSTGIALVGTDADGEGTALLASNMVYAARGFVFSQGATGARIVHNSLLSTADDSPPCPSAERTARWPCSPTRSS